MSEVNSIDVNKTVDPIQSLQDEIAAWSDETFGNASYHRLVPIINHLKIEVGELLKSPYDTIEYADCFMLLLDAARMAGINTEELIKFTFLKLRINKNREWGLPDKDGVVEHGEMDEYGK